jgi:uncharacterized protein YfiM (DUF2279 family)
MIHRVNSSLHTFIKPLRFVFFLLATPILIGGIVSLFAIEESTITQQNWNLTHADIQDVLKAINNPHSKTQHQLELSEKNLNITLSYLLNYYSHGASQITVEQTQLDFKVALLLNNRYFKKYLNFSFKLTKQDGYPSINQLKIGNIHIADEYADLILEKIIQHTPLKDYYTFASEHIKKIHISPAHALVIDYIPPSSTDLKSKLSLHNQSIQSVLFYQQQITHIIAKHNPRWRLSLAELFQPLFKQAYQRSTLKTAVSENRLVLIAISTYVNKSEIESYIPFDISPSTGKQYPAFLYKRPDMAKHFMASAVLAANGASSIAQKLGQQKELNDAKHGSGFSFIDLAGDRAGLTFGQFAIASPTKAKKLQKRIAEIEDYTAFMPEVRDLPEHMSDTDFKNKFKSVDSDRYKKMLAKIDQRISSLEIYQ